MDEDQKRAIGRTSSIVKDLLSITISDCVFFVRCHFGTMLCVDVDSYDEAVGGCGRS